MKKLTATLIAAGVIVGASPAVMAEDGTSYNLGVASNYIWRGASQTNDGFAVQGGLDHAAGPMSFGIWGSNVSTGAEVDLYGAYGGKAGEMDWSVGFIYYYFSDSAFGANNTDVTAGISAGNLSGTVYYNVDAKTTTFEVGGDFEVAKNYTVSALLGSGAAGDASTGSYYDVGVGTSFSGIDVKIGYADAPTTEAKFYLTAGKTF